MKKRLAICSLMMVSLFGVDVSVNGSMAFDLNLSDNVSSNVFMSVSQKTTIKEAPVEPVTLENAGATRHTKQSAKDTAGINYDTTKNKMKMAASTQNLAPDDFVDVSFNSDELEYGLAAKIIAIDEITDFSSTLDIPDTSGPSSDWDASTEVLAQTANPNGEFTCILNNETVNACPAESCDEETCSSFPVMTTFQTDGSGNFDLERDVLCS